jgi:hypothetical protein
MIWDCVIIAGFFLLYYSFSQGSYDYFENPKLLMLIVPVIILLSKHIIDLAKNGAIKNDPFIFMLTDLFSWLAFFTVFSIYTLADQKM